MEVLPSPLGHRSVALLSDGSVSASFAVDSRAETPPGTISSSCGRLPSDLRAQLERDLQSKTELEVVEEAFRSLLDKNNKRLAINSMVGEDPKMLQSMKLLDANGDGYLSYDEIVRGAEALQRHKRKAAQLKYILIFIVCFLFILLAGVFGLVYVVVDIHKDTKALGGKLVSRSNGAPVQVASSDFLVVDGAIVMRPSQSTTSNSGAANPSVADSSWIPSLDEPAAIGDGIVKTAQVTYSWDTLNSGMPNQAVSKISHISLSGGPDSMAPFINAKVDSVVRVPNQNGPGDGSVLLMITSVGRFVVNGTSIIPARDGLATQSLPELYSVSISAALEQTRQLSAERRQASFISTNCNVRNACKPKAGRRGERRDDTVCCIGQIFACNFLTSPQTSWCPPGYFCNPNPLSFTASCSDIVLTYTPATGSASMSRYAGTYSIATLGWDGFPIFFNTAAGVALAFNKGISKWQIIPQDKMYQMISGTIWNGYMSSYAIFTNAHQSPELNWQPHFSAQFTYASNFGVYCPGNSGKVLYEGQYLYYSPPYFRMCAEGYYCPQNNAQIGCDDLQIQAVGTDTNAVGGLYILAKATYYNGFPIYVRTDNARKLVRMERWRLVSHGNGQRPDEYITWYAQQNSFEMDIINDPRKGWDNFVINYAGNSANFYCPYGTKKP